MPPNLSISRAKLAFILGALAMLGPFSIDTIFPAFAVMERDLHVGKLAMQQTISLYLLGYASMSLVHGPLSDALAGPSSSRCMLCSPLHRLAAVIGHDAADVVFPRCQGLSAGCRVDRGTGRVRVRSMVTMPSA